MGEQALESWLGNLISKHPSAVTYRDNLSKFNLKNIRELQQDFANQIQTNRKVSALYNDTFSRQNFSGNFRHLYINNPPEISENILK